MTKKVENKGREKGGTGGERQEGREGGKMEGKRRKGGRNRGSIQHV